MRSNVLFASGFAILALAGAAQASNVLANPGFESGLAGWNTFGNVFADASTPRSGDGVAKMFGGFSGGFNVGGFFQTFAATPGQTWELSGYVRHNTGDNLTGIGNQNPAADNWVVQKFEFRDASDTAIGSTEASVLDGRTATDAWFGNTLSLTAPAGTQSIWAFYLFLQPQFAGGAVLIDDTSLSVVPAPSAIAVLAGAGLLVGRRRR